MRKKKKKVGSDGRKVIKKQQVREGKGVEEKQTEDKKHEAIKRSSCPSDTTENSKDASGTPPMTPQEEKEALKLLKSRNLLFWVGEQIQRAGVAGERRNGLIVYLCCTSRIQRSPNSLLVKGLSAAGKNHLVRTVVLLLPKLAYKELTRMTGQVLLYSNEPLAHRVILICEKEGMEQALYNIRAFQSEGKLVFETVRGLRVEHIEKEGPVSFIATTTAATIHIENETRNWSIYMDETDEQTKRVKDKIADGYSKISSDLSFLTTYQNAQQLLTYYPVKIPYAKFLSQKTPDRPLRMRRDFGKLLAGIETVTLLHQFQREIQENHGIKYLIATLEDYFLAATLLGPTFVESFSGTSQKTQKIVDSIFSLFEKNGKKPVPLKQIEEDLKISRDTIERWINPAVEAGEVEVQGSKGRIAKTYSPGERREWIRGTGLPSPQELTKAFPFLAGNSSAINPITGTRVVIR